MYCFLLEDVERLSYSLFHLLHEELDAIFLITKTSNLRMKQNYEYLAFFSATRVTSSCRPPGRSVTMTENSSSRPSAANPRSITRPRTVESILPPHNGNTTLEEKTTSHDLRSRELID